MLHSTSNYPKIALVELLAQHTMFCPPLIIVIVFFLHFSSFLHFSQGTVGPLGGVRDGFRIPSGSSRAPPLLGTIGIS